MPVALNALDAALPEERSLSPLSLLLNEGTASGSRTPSDAHARTTVEDFSEAYKRTGPAQLDLFALTKLTAGSVREAVASPEVFDVCKRDYESK